MIPKARIHVVFFQGEESSGNLYYSEIRSGGSTLSQPIRVNSEPGSAGAIGTVRTAHIAIGRNGRVHAVWNRVLSSGKTYEA